ncbi:BnaCnng42110D [Brassica napus]|uniref:BnaCnng42110D protein n=1 Tax=Brassica napus TaxID=3708 RepID=A0A078JBG4_BRANA|nr:BnaCnng42110D [Brassica napus]
MRTKPSSWSLLWPKLTSERAMNDIVIISHTACYLEKYSTAKSALEKGASVAPNESKFKKMLDECNLLIAEEEKDLVQQMPPTFPSNSTTPLATAADDPPLPSPAKPMFRHEFYQKPEEVVVTIFAKGIPKQNVNVEFGDQIVKDAYRFQPRLFGKMIPEKCRYEVLSTNVQVPLLPKSNVASVVSHRPVYPSSKPRKDWDKLEAEVKKQSADEDMRRAMKKSFAESNGTVLSTNWKEVGTKKVESTPPDGIELKKWEYLFKYSFLCLVKNSDKYLNFNLFWFLLEFSLHSCGAV